MKSKKIFKITGFIILGLLLIAAGFIVFYYYQYWGKYEVNSEKYTQNVGFIDTEAAVQLTDDYSLCGEGQLLGYYQSAAPNIYKGNKKRFREFILSNYQKKAFNDNGYLNLRFHINCDGVVGNLEINELNNDFQRADFSENVVDHIIELIARADNWQTYAGGDNNYYMYLNLKIEDGEITEIIP